jgi:hypothetical protein
LNRRARTVQIAFCQRHSGLQLPPERLQMRIAGGQGVLRVVLLTLSLPESLICMIRF